MTNLGAWCAVALLLLAAPAWAGATLHGVVVRDREHGAPMAGVELTAPGANPFTTGNDGQFALAFREGHPGQDITVRVSRSGWEVVNDVLLDRPLPEPASTHLFEVIVCVGAEREQRRMEFYRLKGNQAVEQTYRAKLAELEGKHAATVQERDRLRRERDDARKQVDEWARQAAARKSMAGVRPLLPRHPGRQILARQGSDRALVAWTLKRLGILSADEHRNTEARNEFEDALALYRALARKNPDVHRPDLARTLNNLGNLNRDENHSAEARKVFEEALAIYRDFAARAPATYERRVQQVEQDLRDLGPVSP